MSNSLNLGNGDWATKDNSLLGYNSENGNFKPLPFNFSRGSLATVINKQGLIETVQANNARVDYLDNAKGALKLEPQRNNLVTYSEDFSQSYWTKTSVSITSNSILSPDGNLNASTITEGSTLNNHRISVNGLVGSGTHTVSVFAKANDRNWLIIRNAANNAWFDVLNGVVGTVESGNGSIENYGNGWYRCSVTMSSLSTPAVGVSDNNGSYSYQGNGIGSLYIYGAQLEVGSYPTSYIKTQGTAQTRLADVCNNGANEQVINSTEGVLYAEIAPLANDLTNRHIGISDNTRANRLQIFFNTYGTTQIRTLNLVNSVKYFDMQTNVTLVNGYAKVAVKYKENDFALWVNGVEAATDNSGLVWSNGVLDTLKFSDGNNASPFKGNVKDVRVYNTALSNSELQALTTI